jgi:uncharacterized protein
VNGRPEGGDARPDRHRTLVPLDRAECLALLATRPFGRLVYTHRALPAVLPVNHRMEGDDVLIRLQAGSAAALATRDAVVAFEADDVDVGSRTGWSVTVVGRAREITDPGDRLRVVALQLEPWVGDHRDHVLAVAVEQVTGQRLV